jgi:hypothetical protein
MIMSQTAQSTAPEISQKWWKYGHVWMVVGGPAIVVVASFVTLYLAISRPDPVMDENYYQKGIEINKTLGGTPSSTSPAMQARNHAATGVPKPSDAP